MATGDASDDREHGRETPSLLERLCAQLPIVGALFAGAALGWILSIATLLAAEPGSGAAVVSWLNIGGILVIMGWTGYVIHRCRQI